VTSGTPLADEKNTPANPLASTVADDAATEDALSVDDDALVIYQLYSNLRC
jgi:hypothetical protein